jgi:hypothetical protein
MATKTDDLYPASLEIDYPQKLDRVSSFFRILWAIPAMTILLLLTASGDNSFMNETGKEMSSNGSGITMGLFAATALVILFRQRYPRWWFDFVLELNRFTTRVGAYLFLLTDQYPSTVEKQSVHMDIVYPDVKQDLNRWLPIVKWLLALPHYIVLTILMIGVFVVVIIAWFAILFTGRYPRGLFDYVVGVARWNLRVSAYAFFLTTDQYPPFSLR